MVWIPPKKFFEFKNQMYKRLKNSRFEDQFCGPNPDADP